MPGNKVDEDVIIGGLLKYKEFERFYYAEWEPKRNDISIEWEINPSCNGFASQRSDEIDGELKHFIQLRKMPKTSNDAFLVAHEVSHIMKYLDNQYLKFAVDRSINIKYKFDDIVELTFRIGSMFDDPIIDSFLQSVYGFKPAIHYVKVVIPDTVKSLNSSGDPIDELVRIKRALFYAQCSLQWGFITNANSLRKWQDLKELYRKKRPIVTGIGEEIYHMSKEIGYDTLEKQRELSNRLLDKYTIDNIKLGAIVQAM